LGISQLIDNIEIENISGVDFLNGKEKKCILSEVQFKITNSEALI
jgi:hypothetical protein